MNDDGTLLAYSTDDTGFRQYRLHVKNLATGAMWNRAFDKTISVAWAADARLHLLLDRGWQAGDVHLMNGDGTFPAARLDHRAADLPLHRR